MVGDELLEFLEVEMEEEEEEEEEEEIILFRKCLMNHIILGSIFENLKGEDLKRCRLVCKTWYETATKLLAGKVCLRLSTLRFPCHDQRGFHLRVCKTEKYIECPVKAIQGLPVGNLGLCYSSSGWEYPGIVAHLMKSSGELVKDLRIQDVNTNSPGWISEIVYWMPNLEELDVEMANFRIYDQCEAMLRLDAEPEVIRGLKEEGLGKLKSLRVGGHRHHYESSSQEVLLQLMKLCVPSVLKRLGMDLSSLRNLRKLLLEVQNFYYEGTGLEELCAGDAYKRAKRIGSEDGGIGSLRDILTLPMLSGLKYLEINMPVPGEELRYILESGSLPCLTSLRITPLIKAVLKEKRLMILEGDNKDSDEELDYLCWLPLDYELAPLRMLDVVIILVVGDCYDSPPRGFVAKSGRVMPDLEKLFLGFKYVPMYRHEVEDVIVDAAEGFEAVFPFLETLIITTEMTGSVMEKWRRHMPDTLTHLVVSGWEDRRCPSCKPRKSIRLPGIPGLKELRLMGDVGCLIDGRTPGGCWKLRKLERIANDEFHPEISLDQQYAIRDILKRCSAKEDESEVVVMEEGGMSILENIRKTVIETWCILMAAYYRFWLVLTFIWNRVFHCTPWGWDPSD